MKKRFICLFVYLLAVFGVISLHALEIPADAVQIECELRPLSDSHKHHHIGAREHGTNPHIPVFEGLSTNWSGYAALTNLTHPTKGSVTNVSGSWIVPRVVKSAGSTTTYSSVWVGIDGYSDSTVEQIGTEHDWTSHGQQNYAWFEMYPAGGYEIVGFPVNVNDLISAQVLYSGNNVFTLTIINYTHGVYFVVPTSYTRSSVAQRTSAEWIVEAPSSYSGVLPLSDFGVATLSNCMATINGVSGGINNSKWQYDPLIMVTPNLTIKAVPTTLSNGGKNFSVVWEHQ